MFVLTLAVAVVVSAAVFALLLFVPAGTIHWWRAWAFLIVQFVGSAWGIAALLPGHRDLLEERMRSPIQKGQPFADKILTTILLLGFYGMIVFTSFDVFHLHLLPPPPFAVSCVGAGLYLVGGWIAYLSLRENAFAAPVVKHMDERGQKVVDTGVYAVVRHPMYAGGVMVMIGMPIWLGSWAGTIAALVPIAGMTLRIGIEEGLLVRKLDGYDDYRRRVRYRLIPGIW